MEKNNKGIVTLLVVFIFTTLVLGGYLVYDKVLSKDSVNDNTNVENSSTTNEENNEKTTETTYNEEYFNDLLSMFYSRMNYYMKNISNFDNNEITEYLIFYYSNYANKNNLSTYDDSGNLVYNVKKSDMDSIVFKTFGKSEYKIVDKNARTGIRKIDDNTYQVYWFATGWYNPDKKLINTNILSDSAVIEYELIGNDVFGTKDVTSGTIKFYLTKNGENWNVTKIEYNEK